LLILRAGKVDQATGGKTAPATKKVNQTTSGVAKTGSDAAKGATGTASNAAKGVSSTASGVSGNLANTGKNTYSSLKKGDFKGTASGMSSSDNLERTHRANYSFQAWHLGTYRLCPEHTCPLLTSNLALDRRWQELERESIPPYLELVMA